MEFANPLGLLGLLALPAILAIHLFHRRFPPRLVAGLHLWGAEVRVPTAGRKRERLPISASLILELLAALLVTMVLAQPRLSDAGRVLHLIAVLDNSASMSAVAADGASFRDRAILEVARRLDEAPRGSRITLILTGRRPVMLAGPAVDWSDAEALIADWVPAQPNHDMLPALDMAAQLAESGGDVLFLTDAMPDRDQSIPEAVEVVAVGESLSNVAITAARWSLDSTTLTGRIFLRVRNEGPRATVAVIQGHAGSQEVFRSTLELEPTAELPLQTEVPGGLGRLRITVTADKDSLAVDSQVYLVEPKVRTVRVAIGLPEDHAGLSPISRVLSVTPDIELSEPESAHLMFASAGSLPESRGSLWWLGIGPIDESEEARKNARDLLGPYLRDKRDPLIDGISLGGIIWGGVQPVDVSVTPVISAGREVLLGRLSGTRTTALLLNIDPARSNLTESPDWPILISNLVELRRASLPGLRRWNYRLNEDIQFRLFEGLIEPAGDSGRKLTFQKDSGRSPASRVRNLVRSAIVEIPSVDETGFFRVEDDEEVVGEFAVNFFDPKESNLTSLGPGHLVPPTAQDGVDYRIDNPLTWVILGGLVLIMLLAFADWYVLKPRSFTSG